MLDVAADSDDAIMYPRQAEWRMSSPINLLGKIVREVEVVPGIVGLPSGDLQRTVVGICLKWRGGELVKVLIKRVGHLGFELCDVLAQNLSLNVNCVAKFVKPFVLTAVIKSVCNASPTSRGYGHNIAPHCRLGCFAVAGDGLRHYPFCPVVEGFIRSEGDLGVCLWFRNRSLGHMLLLHPVNFEAMVTSSLWADIIYQARTSSTNGRGTDFLFSRFRTVLARVSLANLRIGL